MYLILLTERAFGVQPDLYTQNYLFIGVTLSYIEKFVEENHFI